ncbi:MAG: transketolase family protein, partial [Lachnospiraceae bacterium]|nr:transketolase family protein [Lachnospiraceae bacterium]
AVAEVLSEECPTRMTRIGVRDRFGESGTAAELIHKYGLDGEGIAKSVAAFVRG